MSHSPTAGLRRERLANGVTLLVQRRRSAPAAALITRIGAGFLDEPDTLVGVSHVLEHMLFKGTPRLGPGELARRTKALGGSLNAHTAYERTVYHAVVPVRAAAELALLQADQVRNALIDPDELQRELGVIIQEAQRKLKTKNCDMVVGNIVGASDLGFESDENEVVLALRTGETIALPRASKRAIADRIFDEVLNLRLALHAANGR